MIYIHTRVHTLHVSYGRVAWVRGRTPLTYRNLSRRTTCPLRTNGGPVLHYIAPRTSPTLASNHHTGLRRERVEGKIMGKKEAPARGCGQDGKAKRACQDLTICRSTSQRLHGSQARPPRFATLPGRSYCKQLAQAKPAACSACSACNGRFLCLSVHVVHVHTVVRADCFWRRKRNAARLKSPGSHGRTEAVKPWKKRC